MLRHSLEVGLWALQQTEGKLIRGVTTPQQRRVMEPRWRLAVFLAGICHDLGKVVTDLTVTDRANAQRWRPYPIFNIHQKILFPVMQLARTSVATVHFARYFLVN